MNKTRSACISFEEFINHLNLFYICIWLYLHHDNIYGTHELECGLIFFGRAKFSTVSKIFVFFYVFNFGVVLFMHI
jgi:hypothetical protein